MTPRLLSLFLLVASFSWPAQAQDVAAKPDKPKGISAQVDLISLQVTKLARDQFGQGIKGPDGSAFWLASTGTAVALRFKTDGPILGFDTKASQILRFTDDKGTDLTRPQDGKPVDLFWRGNHPLVLKPGPGFNHGEVLVRGFQIPATGATKLILQASIVIRTGSGEKIAEQKGIPLGSKVELGPVTVVVGSQDKAGYVSFSIQGREMVKQLYFLGSDGKEQGTGILMPGLAGNRILSLAPKGIDRVSLRLVYYEKIAFRTVLIRLETGLGF